MLSRYNALEIEQALRAAPFEPPFPPAADRAAWEQLKTQLGEAQVAELTGLAEAAAAELPAPMPATLYLDVKRTGNRVPYEIVMYQHRLPLRDLLIGECLEGQGRFLDPILNFAWAICEESSWAFPAHHPNLPDPSDPLYDLGAGMTAFALAELDLLLGEALDPDLRRRIRLEVDQRCFRPYLQRHDFRWLYNTAGHTVNNWSAVCNACAMAAALYLEPDPARQADILAKGARSLDDYLATFDADGGSSEGPGYWNYGFGYYVLIAQLVEQRTRGWMDFYSEPIVRAAAQFPLRTVLNQNAYATFSDCDRQPLFVSALLTHLGRRLQIPELAALARVQPVVYRRLEQAGALSGGHLARLVGPRRFEIMWAIRDVCWSPEPPSAGETPTGPAPALRDYFREMGWMFARYRPDDPDGLVLAAKGGHNQEMHNQNDVGSFIVYTRGRCLINDLGRGRYTRQYFGPERYQHLLNSSLGHSTPAPNGQVQPAGRQWAAQVVEYSPGAEADRFVLEMKDAYPPEAGLRSLRRAWVLRRDLPGGRVELEDAFAFATGPGSFETALITQAQVALEPGAVRLSDGPASLRVVFDAQQVTVCLEQHEAIDFPEGPETVTRVVFAMNEPRSQGAIRLQIDPQ